MTTSSKPNDISRGWLPITVVGTLLVAVLSVGYWAATEHANVVAAQATADAAMKAAEAAGARALAAEARAAAAEVAASAKSAEVLAKLAGIESGVQSLRTQNNGMEIQLAELRAALLRGGRP